MLIILYYIGGNDYTSGPFTVTFNAEITRASFSVSIIDDNVLEGNETFDLTIDPSSLANNKITVGDPGQVTVTIVDNDGK